MQKKKRLIVLVEPETKKHLEDMVQWGQLTHLVESLVEDLVTILRRFPENKRKLIISAVVAKQISLQQLIKYLEKHDGKTINPANEHSKSS